MIGIKGKIERRHCRNALASYEDHLDDNGSISVTEWPNGEGFDFDINSGKDGCGSNCLGQMTWTQFHILQTLTQEVLKNDE